MNKKDLGLFILIVVVGAIVALINPRFLLPINIANTANLVGMFGISALGEAFVIITAGIELSVGSMIALIGVLFVDFIANRGVPWPIAIALIVIAIVMWVVLHRSVFGRYLYAIGKNEEAAKYSGIRTGRVVTSAYVICGVLTALSAIYFAMYTRSISPASHGQFYELYAIAAAVLGGFSLRGGEGSLIGVILGTVLLQELQNLVNLLGIPSSLNFAVMGGVILIGVLVDQQWGVFRARRRMMEATRRNVAGAPAE